MSIDPVRRTWRWWPPVDGPVTVLSVYRACNAERLANLLSSVPRSWTVRLWSLDAVAAPVADRTVGQGPGGRLQLFNRMLEQVPPERRRCGLVLLDDDCSFVGGDLPALLAAGTSLRLDVFQPAHSPRSHCSYEHVRRRWGVVARLTTFVEEGPVVVLSAAAQEHLLPFSTSTAMGWGEDVRWSIAAGQAGLRMGIIDSIPVRHLTAPATGYARGEEEKALRSVLRAAGAGGLGDLQRDLRVLRTADLAGGRRRNDGAP